MIFSELSICDIPYLFEYRSTHFFGNLAVKNLGLTYNRNPGLPYFAVCFSVTRTGNLRCTYMRINMVIPVSPSSHSNYHQCYHQCCLPFSRLRGRVRTISRRIADASLSKRGTSFSRAVRLKTRRHKMNTEARAYISTIYNSRKASSTEKETCPTRFHKCWKHSANVKNGGQSKVLETI